MSNTELAKLRDETGIKLTENLTEDQTALLFEKISRQELSQDQIAVLIKVVPAFVESFTETVKNMAKMSSDLRETNKHAFEALKTAEVFVEPLNILAKDCDSKEERLVLADTIQKVVFKICDTTTEIQKESNRTFQEFINKIGKPALALFAGCFLGYALAGGKSASGSISDNSKME